MPTPASRDVFADAAESIDELIRNVVAAQKLCSIVVSGGSAIRDTLRQLATLDVSWSSVHLYMTDERCVPRGDRDRNDAMINEVLVQPVHLNSENFYPIPAELGPLKGAQSYARTLSNIDHFDIALFGVGPDGHIASLFPNHPSIENTERVVAVENSPKFPPNRVSVGLTMLRGSTHRIVVVAGGEKSDLITRIQMGQKPPVALVDPTKWFLDSEVVGFRGDSATTTQQGRIS